MGRTIAKHCLSVLPFLFVSLAGASAIGACQSNVHDDDMLEDFAGADWDGASESATAGLRVLPAADATIRSGNFSQTNYGSERSVKQDLDSSGTILRGFIRFEGNDGETILRARLMLYVTNGSKTGASIHQISEPSWSERDITWSRRPEIDGPIVATIRSARAGSWVEIDLTQVVVPGIPLSLALVARSDDGFAFASKESSRPPFLMLTLDEPGASDAGTPPDVGFGADGGTVADATQSADAGIHADAADTSDAGERPDAQTNPIVDLCQSSCFEKPASAVRSLTGPNPAAFTAVSGNTYVGLRQTFTENNIDGSAGILHISDGADICVVGAKLIGPITEQVPWLSALKPDGIQHSHTAGLYTVHGAWMRGVNDALSPPKSGSTSRSARFSYRDVYIGQAHDDALENDACLGGEIRDTLIDGTHMGFSSRPGGPVSFPTPRTTVRLENMMLRLICQADTRDKATQSSCPTGTSHATFFKTSPDCQFTDGNDVRYALRNVILRADHRPIQGVSGLDIPADASIENVTVIYLGPNPQDLPRYPSGVRVITDSVEGNRVWNEAKNRWLADHGCDANGDECQYLNRTCP